MGRLKVLGVDAVGGQRQGGAVGFIPHCKRVGPWQAGGNRRAVGRSWVGTPLGWRARTRLLPLAERGRRAQGQQSLQVALPLRPAARELHHARLGGRLARPRQRQPDGQRAEGAAGAEGGTQLLGGCKDVAQHLLLSQGTQRAGTGHVSKGFGGFAQGWVAEPQGAREQEQHRGAGWA